MIHDIRKIRIGGPNGPVIYIKAGLSAAEIEAISHQRANEPHEPPPPHGIKQSYVKANSPIANPCLSENYYLEHFHKLSPAIAFDKYGCRIDPTAGYRMLDDCRTQAEGENRWLCPNVPVNYQGDDSMERFVGFISAAGPMLGRIAISIILPELGNMAAEALDFLSKELTTVSDWVYETVDKITSALNEPASALTNELKQDLASVAGTVKMVADGLNLSIPQNAQLISYIGARDSMNTISKILGGDEKAIQSVVSLATQACAGIKTLEAGKRCQDARRSLSMYQMAWDEIKNDPQNRLANPTAERVKALVNSTPDVRNSVSPDTINNLLNKGTQTPGMGTAIRFQQNYLAQGDKVLTDSSQNIGNFFKDVLPKDKLSGVMDQINQSLPIHDLIDSAVKAAQGALNDGVRDAESVIAGIPTLVQRATDGLSAQLRADLHKQARQKLLDAAKTADRIIETSIPNIGPNQKPKHSKFVEQIEKWLGIKE